MNNQNKIELVVFDWAGTTVDYGSSAPSEVFERIFSAASLHLSKEEINRPMGLEKKAHIRELLASESGRSQWQKQYGCSWCEEDVENLYQNFENTLHEVVAERSQPMHERDWRKNWRRFWAVKWKKYRQVITTQLSKRCVQEVQKWHTWACRHWLWGWNAPIWSRS